MNAQLRCMVAVLPVFLGGCVGGNVKEVADPQNISIEDAMKQVAQGIKYLVDFEKQNNVQMGTIIDEVDLNFQVSASAQKDGKLTLSPSVPILVHGSASLGYSQEDVSAAQRGSSIQIKLKNVITAPLNAVGCHYFLRDTPDMEKECAASKPSAAAPPVKQTPAAGNSPSTQPQTGKGRGPTAPSGQQPPKSSLLTIPPPAGVRAGLLEGIAASVQRELSVQGLDLRVAEVTHREN